MAIKEIENPQKFNDNYTDQDRQDVLNIIAWVNSAKSRNQRWLSRCVGVSDAYISTLLTGKHAIAADDLISKIKAVMEDNQLEKLQGEFIETSVARIVFHACTMAKEAEDGGFVVIAGSPGVGKSTGLGEYQKKHPNTIYIVGSESTNGSAVLDMILQQLNIKFSSGTKKKAKEDMIIDALKGTNRLIILDETDKCHIDTPDPLRTISDKAKIGVVLAGNVQLRDAVYTGEGRYDLIQDRVVFWPPLINQVQTQDVALLLAPWFTKDLLDPSETFEEVADYAGKLVSGSARKLIKGLVKNTLKLDKLSRERETNPKYKGITRDMLSKVAQNFLGIRHPEPVPRKPTAVNV